VLNNLLDFVLNRLESAEGINTTHMKDLEKEIPEEDIRVITLITLLGE